MSSISISTLPRIYRDDLAAILRRTDPTKATDVADSTGAAHATALTDPNYLAIIDVRDSDHVGGHIRSSIWASSSQLDTQMPELIRTLKDKKMVVFHCALSQQRGPSAALRYLRGREKFDGKEENPNQEVFVLDGGFVEWQKKFGNDGALTEAYAADIWEEY